MNLPPDDDAFSCCWDDLITRSALPRLDARALLEHVSGRSRTWLLAHGDEAVPQAQQLAFEQLSARRARGEPLAYLVGGKEFMGLRFGVGPEVLVPRPETEHLVEWTLALGDALGDSTPQRPIRLLDLGTGSGAIALSVAQARPHWRITATDRSPEALARAKDNAQGLGLGAIEWRLGSWWAALTPSDGPFDLVVSNPPYLAAQDPHLQDPALQHEPQSALVSGPSGLEALEAIVAQADKHLRGGGWLVLEHGASQGDEVRALLAQAGLCDILTGQDLAGRDRLTRGSIPKV